MKAAGEIQRVVDGLWFWQAYQPAVKVDCSSCALRVGERLVLVDPIPLAAGALAELRAQGGPAAIIATNGNHDRAIADLRQELGVPVFAHAQAAPALGLPVDRFLEDDEEVFPGLRALTLPGAGPGEVALSDARGWLILGDALIHLEPTGLDLLPDKYCEDPRQLRRSAQKLLRFPTEVLTFAHGLPLVSRARARLEALLA